MSRILFCSPTPLTPRLGSSKVFLEVAEAFRRIGWTVTVVGPDEGTGDAARLRDYLRQEAANHDVVEFNHNALPYPRADFPPGPLFVARSVLLTHTIVAARIPPRPTLRSRFAHLLKGRQRRRLWESRLREVNATIAGADVVNVGNADERDALVASGCPMEKIIVQPFGLFPERLAAFHPSPNDLPDPPRIAFVGTFDPRKGMGEWPAIVNAVTASHPAVQFRLLGTTGMVPTAAAVLGYFPRRQRSRVEVIPRFEPAELPARLADCTLGVFPSHCEGFPFGILEMLAGGLPVAAYRAPGAPMMLPAEDLTPKGDGHALGRRVAELLCNPPALREARRSARAVAESFRWEEIAARTADFYLGERDRLQSARQ